jgi:hypothetical protein
MNTDTPETDAMVSADQHHLEDDNFFSASVYWRMCDLARTLERERDELKRWTSVNGVIDLQRERDEAREYADKLAEGLPDGMLPKDVEVLREANLGLATELAAVTAQRDRLAEALIEMLNYAHDCRLCTVQKAQLALAAVKGGSDE